MRPFYIATLVLSAVFAYAAPKSDVAKDEPIHQYADKKNLKCDSNTSHCIYMKNAKSYGAADGTWIRCARVDDEGYGYDVCQFPAYASVTIGCIPDGGASGISVGFGDGKSVPNEFTKLGYNVKAVWSSEKRKTGRIDGKMQFSSQAGDDVYVSCS